MPASSLKIDTPEWGFQKRLHSYPPSKSNESLSTFPELVGVLDDLARNHGIPRVRDILHKLTRSESRKLCLLTLDYMMLPVRKEKEREKFRKCIGRTITHIRVRWQGS